MVDCGFSLSHIIAVLFGALDDVELVLPLMAAMRSILMLRDAVYT